MKIKLTKSQQKLFKFYGTIHFNSSNNEEFYYLPFWIKKNRDETFELLRYDELPKELIDDIKSMQDYIPSKESVDEILLKYPRTEAEAYKDIYDGKDDKIIIFEKATPETYDGSNVDVTHLDEAASLSPEEIRKFWDEWDDADKK